MKKVTVKDRQSIFDIAIQEFGTLQNLFDILKDNNLTLDSQLSGGQELIINNEGKGVENVKQVMLLEEIQPNNKFTFVTPSMPATFDSTITTWDNVTLTWDTDIV